ncbi:MAG: hypothetical protein COZ06_01285 [Armatimonadetes bacterium CG_4_10_14_3_um_filter_66_18]|nr:hypothetical protein [Armatimonadota bacterium]OIO95079.1 MAG: hypothetical protein AUJ96_27585 [Armatimonadetes bacterium CG2_30_66_41]PIU93000.1 MAG: hypothetical protein COS65_14985 [Armatimonadetes bacterium CG06_land_8_20_14_3_00_66_21]PIX44317.1 MAG: hypothetical protein COZ57_17670 [Armatimonadetes bacterium CG_4_8_14_3_um_filter_66_20]PIY53689.1 MAG: hypothetical protein COZ06_01285 [Armatimonadetes bacterium CG_4_10_14_3_um_filter_66_18]PIZ49777.1 MAG: hypothetical protein COY42_03
MSAHLAPAGAGDAPTLPDRWVYVSRNLNRDQDVDDIRAIATTASQHGLNGMLLTGSFDTLDLRDAAYFARLEQVKALCRERSIEIIPIIFSAGYGGGVRAHDPNLAAGLPVVDAPYVVRNGEAVLVPEGGVKLVNGGFEEAEGQKLPGFDFYDKPGEIAHLDHEIFKEGGTALRFERVAEFSPDHGHARVMQQVKVKPHRFYRLSLWVRTKNLQPKSAFRLQVYTEKRALASVDPGLSGTNDWTQVALDFNSADNEMLGFYLGQWGGKSGTVWLDDLRLEERSLVNVVRRPGCPVIVRSEDGATTYDEGRDYEPLPPLQRFRANADPTPLKVVAGGRIKDGDRLRLSYYHALSINQGQVSVCMSEPKLYEIWSQVAVEIHKRLAPSKWFLSMDEIRMGGSCAACKARGMTMGEILGDCLTKQVQLIRALDPKAEVYVWSDMLDPNHNAHGDYYLVDGDFTGSWEHVPKDLIIACWYHKIRDKSLKSFSALGFRTLGGAYYDSNSLDGCRDWLASLQRTPKARGIMYTTWQNKYELLAGFGELVSK